VWRRSDFKRLHSLSPAERRVLLAACLLLPSYAIRVRLFGLRRAQANLPGLSTAASPVVPERIARLVAVAARRAFFRAGCLPTSLALQHLLALRGIASELRLGVGKPNGRFEAHAWIERDGTVLLDLRDRDREFHALERAATPLG
jgi:hypothetical protein